MDKSEYAINEAIEGAKRGLAELKEMKNQVKKAVEDEQQEKEISQSDKEVISIMGLISLDEAEHMEAGTSKN